MVVNASDDTIRRDNEEQALERVERGGEWQAEEREASDMGEQEGIEESQSEVRDPTTGRTNHAALDATGQGTSMTPLASVPL
jgi:hypothetical protein